jgi:large subunit ribosomal protein L30e
VIDFGRAILIAMKTGKLVFGSENATEAARSGKARMVVVASNCPEGTKSRIKAFAELSKIPVYEYNGSSVDLGLLCQKPFVVAAITVRDPGDSDIMKLVQT